MKMFTSRLVLMFQNYFENFIANIQISEYKYNSTSGDMLKVWVFFIIHVSMRVLLLKLL